MLLGFLFFEFVSVKLLEPIAFVAEVSIKTSGAELGKTFKLSLSSSEWVIQSVTTCSSVVCIFTSSVKFKK